MVMENLRNIFRMNYNEGVEVGIEKRNKRTEYRVEFKQQHVILLFKC